jgi:hypothetical protein
LEFYPCLFPNKKPTGSKNGLLAAVILNCQQVRDPFFIVDNGINFLSWIRKTEMMTNHTIIQIITKIFVVA